MSIRRLFAVLAVIQIVLVGATGAFVVLILRTQAELGRTENRRYASYKLADELRQSSDDLTRFARTYVVTGEPRYEEYFNRILAIRNGELPRPHGLDGIYWDFVAAGATESEIAGEAKSLEQRMVEAGFTVSEFSLLKAAENRSDDLARLERVAMNARKGRFDDGTGAFVIEKAPDLELASSLMFGERYHKTKAEIMRPIDAFLEEVDARTTGEVESIREEARTYVVALIGLCVILLGSTAATFEILRRRLLRPVDVMANVARRVGEGDWSARSNIHGPDEVGRLGRILDQTIETVEHSVAELEHARAKAESRAHELAAEREKSEELLRNILPGSIAARLKTGESSIAELFPEVSVLFADIAGFTELSARMSAKQVVDVLNEVFGIFDQMLEEHRLEKIKTIGDCYMVVGGLPQRSATHAQQVADFALAMEQRLREYDERTGQDIKLRIGAHSGTVVAGIIGTKKFAYDLWGDVVNTASRMESHGVPGRIQVSEAFYVRLHDDYAFEERGEIDVKGKGRMSTYFLLGRKH